MSIGADLRHAFRVLRRNPATTAIIVLTLALCIGANTAIFSIVDATLLRPLPYPEPGRLAQVLTRFRGHGIDDTQIGQDGISWIAIHERATFVDAAVFSDIASGVNFSAAGKVQYIKQQRVGAGFFRTLGIPPLIGREFTPAEDSPGGPPLTILSYSLWRRVYGNDPSVVGKSLILSGESYTIAGVMPEHFHTNSVVDLWTPIRPSTTGEGGGTNYGILARLRPGVTWAQADSQIESVGASLAPLWKLPADVTARMGLVPLQETETQEFRKPLLIVWASVGFVLLIGCANVASLLLARAAARSREIATRMALGGGRRAIVRQLMAETLALVVLGGIAGLILGYFALEGLKIMGEQHFAMVGSAHLDARVLAATMLISILVSILAGIFPALEAGTVDLRTALSEAGGRGVAGQRRRWPRRLLVAGEIALAVMLLIGAGLMLRMLAHFYQLRPGFEPAHVLTASFSLQDARYDSNERVTRFFEAGLEQIRALPGIESAGAGLTMPYERPLNMGIRRIDGPDAGPETFVANACYVTAGYFETLRIPLLRGRTIRESDAATSGLVAVVNDAFARRYLSRQEAVGSHIRFSDDRIPREVIGVAGDVPQASNFGNSGAFESRPLIYMPVAQASSALLKLVHVWFAPSWVVRARGSSAQVIRGIQESVAAIDPLLPIAEFRTIDDLRSAKLSLERFQAALLGSLAGLALLLAMVGIYGLMNHSVQERRRELGMRMALGSTLAQAIREAVRPGIVLALTGVLAGCAAAALATKVLQHLVNGVSPTDPVTYASVAIGLLAMAGIASLVPALRITRLSPADTLREE